MAKTDILRSENGVDGFTSGPATGPEAPKPDWKEQINVWKLIIITASAVMVLLVFHLIVYLGVLSTPGFANDSKLTMVHEDNKYKLSWKSMRDKYDDRYIVKIYEGKNVNPKSSDSESKVIYTNEYMESEIPRNDDNKLEVYFMNDFLKDKEVTIYVDSIKHFGYMSRAGKKPVLASINLAEPAVYNMDVNIDEESGTISFKTGRGSSGFYSLYLEKKMADGSSLTSTDSTGATNQVVGSANQPEGNGIVRLDEMNLEHDSMNLELNFNDGKITMPEEGELYTFYLVGEYTEDNLSYYDFNYNPIVLNRENFLTGKVSVCVANDGYNRYTFTWNETKGDGYKISVYDNAADSWVQIAELTDDDARYYKTSKLLPCKEYRYRVEAVGTGEDVSEEERVNEVTFKTIPSTLYATIWPTTELKIYKDSTSDEVIGTVDALEAYSVEDEKDGRFLIKTGMTKKSKEGYIDSNYCMINLPEYMGELCQYDITNSYCSRYTAQGYAIPSISGNVLKGYDDSLLNDGTFIVPLLYPCAKKLVMAANLAAEQGYKFMITDAYTPGKASDQLYKAASDALPYSVPKKEFKSVSLKKYRDGKKASVTELSSLKKPDNKSSKTYESLMLNKGKVKLTTLISDKDSYHNYGVALDMTLVNIETGDKEKMQTDIHDMSYKSFSEKNNDSANKLKALMENAGFTAAKSKWWMYYDKDISDGMKLSGLSGGVSIEGWKKDDYGWRYRKADGEYYNNETVKIGKHKYTFGENSYLAE